jgi:alkanesulfonate monooxygenase SsuD/methylene tetrahydromethanopterin reductase-like flavin-dependent oxidoreductase (luciferase family)
MDKIWSEQEKAALQQQLGSSIIGGPEVVKSKLKRFIEATGADEIMIAAHIFDHKARLRSYEIAAGI